MRERERQVNLIRRRWSVPRFFIYSLAINIVAKHHHPSIFFFNSIRFTYIFLANEKIVRRLRFDKCIWICTMPRSNVPFDANNYLSAASIFAPTFSVCRVPGHVTDSNRVDKVHEAWIMSFLYSFWFSVCIWMLAMWSRANKMRSSSISSTINIDETIIKPMLQI